MSEEFKKRFWGSQKVVALEPVDHKTPAKSPVFKMVFEDGGFEYVTEEAYLEFSTKKKSDDTDLRKRRFRFLNQKLLVMLMEYGGVKYGDIESFTMGLKNQIFESFNRADNFLWTNNDDLFVPGMPAIDERSLLEADFILNNMNNKE